MFWDSIGLLALGAAAGTVIGSIIMFLGVRGAGFIKSISTPRAIIRLTSVFMIFLGAITTLTVIFSLAASIFNAPFIRNTAELGPLTVGLFFSGGVPAAIGLALLANLDNLVPKDQN